MKKFKQEGAIDIAHRVKGICGEVFRYGVNSDKCKFDPTQSIKGVLIPKRNKNMATIIDPEKIGELLRAIDGYDGNIETKCALRLIPYLMLRPGELRCAEWSEIDLDKMLLKIPAEKMKMRRHHIVHLSSQAVEILKMMQPITGH